MTPRRRALLGVTALLLGAAIVVVAGLLVPGDPILLRALGFGLALGSLPLLARAAVPKP